MHKHAKIFPRLWWIKLSTESGLVISVGLYFVSAVMFRYITRFFKNPPKVSFKTPHFSGAWEHLEQVFVFSWHLVHETQRSCCPHHARLFLILTNLLQSEEDNVSLPLDLGKEGSIGRTCPCIQLLELTILEPAVVPKWFHFWTTALSV